MVSLPLCTFDPSRIPVRVMYSTSSGVRFARLFIDPLAFSVYFTALGTWSFIRIAGTVVEVGGGYTCGVFLVWVGIVCAIEVVTGVEGLFCSTRVFVNGKKLVRL